MAVAITAMSWLAFLFGRAASDPLWKIHRAQDQISIPTEWHLVHEEEQDVAWHGFFGERDEATRIYTTSVDPATACRQSEVSLSAWGTLVEKRARTEDLRSCVYGAVDGCYARFNVWGPAAWETHSEVLDLGVGDGVEDGAVIELLVSDTG